MGLQSNLTFPPPSDPVAQADSPSYFGFFGFTAAKSVARCPSSCCANSDFASDVQPVL